MDNSMLDHIYRSLLRCKVKSTGQVLPEALRRTALFRAMIVRERAEGCFLERSLTVAALKSVSCQSRIQDGKYFYRNCRRHLAFLGLLFFSLCAGRSDGNEIDRLLAAVNGVAITQGDLDLARSLNLLVFPGKNAKPVSRTEEIDRLIDRELMRQELKNFSMAQEDESRMDARLQALRDSHAAEGGLAAFLEKVGLQESELISYLRLESSILKFVDYRFRPFAKVSEEEIKAYYVEQLTPQLQKAKIQMPPLVQVSAKIELILREDKINAVLDQWIKDIRRNSRIEFFDGDGRDLQPEVKVGSFKGSVGGRQTAAKE
jgi:hypothetical protein